MPARAKAVHSALNLDGMNAAPVNPAAKPAMNAGTLVLGIESSCDETGVALVQMRDGAVPALLSHALYSQIEMHQAYGGVVPELASRDHIRRVLPLARSAEGEWRAADLERVLADLAGDTEPGNESFDLHRQFPP